MRQAAGTALDDEFGFRDQLADVGWDQRDAALSCRPLHQDADVDAAGATFWHD